MLYACSGQRLKRFHRGLVITVIALLLSAWLPVTMRVPGQSVDALVQVVLLSSTLIVGALSLLVLIVTFQRWIKYADNDEGGNDLEAGLTQE
jgi:hypothetical protein